MARGQLPVLSLNVTAANYTEGVANDLDDTLYSHAAVGIVSDYSSLSGGHDVLTVQVSLNGTEWIGIAGVPFYGNGIISVTGNFPARYVRATLSPTLTDVTATVTAWVASA